MLSSLTAGREDGARIADRGEAMLVNAAAPSGVAPPMGQAEFILPATDKADTAPFWQATREKRLVVQRCDSCGKTRFPPRPHCGACRSDKLSWPEVSGFAKIFSHIVVYPPVLPAFAKYAPFPAVLVELAEGKHLRMFGNVIAKPGDTINAINPDSLYIGQPVRVHFEVLTDGVTLPRWLLQPEGAR